MGSELRGQDGACPAVVWFALTPPQALQVRWTSKWAEKEIDKAAQKLGSNRQFRRKRKVLPPPADGVKVLRGVAARIDVQATGQCEPEQRDDDAPVLVLPVEAIPSDSRRELALSSNAGSESFANERESEDAVHMNSDVPQAKRRSLRIVSVGVPSNKQKGRSRSRNSSAQRSQLTSVKNSLLSFEDGDDA